MEHQLATLKQRVDLLERQNRLLRRAIAVLFMLVGIGLMIGLRH